MSRKAFTLRLDPKLYKALSVLSDVANRSMNDLITDAVSSFVETESEAAALSMEDMLEKLRAYRRETPDHKAAFAQFAKAETDHEDPLEGEVIGEDGSVQAQLRTLLTNA